MERQDLCGPIILASKRLSVVTAGAAVRFTDSRCLGCIIRSAVREPKPEIATVRMGRLAAFVHHVIRAGLRNAKLAPSGSFCAIVYRTGSRFRYNA